MLDNQHPSISYKQPLFVRESLEHRWKERHNFVRSVSELEAFCQIVAKDPKLKNITLTEPVAREALDFYNQVVADGRFIWHLRDQPDQVAKNLGLQVSDEARSVVSQAAKLTGVGADNDVTIVVAIAIVIVAAKPQNVQEVVIDHSQALELKL